MGPFHADGTTDISAMWEMIQANELPLQALPYAHVASWPYTHALLAAEPKVERLGLDRKLLRTTEKSMRLCIAAANAVAQHPWLGDSPSTGRTGVYLGVPSIEDSVPGWDTLQALSLPGEGIERLGFHAQHTAQPMVGLVRLNSTLSAHLSIAHHCSGANAAFSPFADAGVQALIEAALSIAEGENDAALAGGTAMHLNETSALQWRALALSRFGVLPGEGAGMVKVERHTTAGDVLRLRGYGRCFQADEPRLALAQAVRLACEMAGEAASWIISDLPLPDDSPIPHLPLAQRAGWLGGAHGVTALALAAHGLKHRRRLVALSDHWSTADGPPGCVAIAGCSPHGQAAAILVILGQALPKGGDA